MRQDETPEKRMTIGKIARMIGLRTSAIRYYEEQGLIRPAERNEAGYRLYGVEVVEELRFLRRAQHLGFSLADIRILLDGWRGGTLDQYSLIETAENRYLELEREATALLTLQHELGLLLQDIYARKPRQEPAELLSQLIDHICLNPLNSPAQIVFDRLLEKAGCEVTSLEAKNLMDDLKKEHIHVWNDEGVYSILVVSDDPQVGEILKKFARLASDCNAHEHVHQIPELMHNSDGYLLVVRGTHAFIIARLFLELARQPKSEPI